MKKTLSGFMTKKLPVLIILLIFAGITPLLALDFRVDVPEFRVNPTSRYRELLDPSTGDTNVIRDINREIKNAVDGLKAEIDKETEGFDGNPRKLIGAFANSSVFASNGATQRAFEGYDKYAVTIGSMIGFQLPSSPFSILNEIDGIYDKVMDDGDIEFGLNPQVLNTQVGINTSKFLLDNLYLGAKLGFMNLSPSISVSDDLSGGLSFQTLSVGVTGNYQFLAHKSIAGGLVHWRGVNFGTGFIYQRTNLDINAKMKKFTETQRVGGLNTYDKTLYDALIVLKNFNEGDPGYEEAKEYFKNTFNISDTVIDDLAHIPTEILTGFNVDVSATPEVILDLGINTFTIPLEAMTSVRLLKFLNLSFGLGVDIGFGSADIKVTGKATADIEYPQNIKDHISMPQGENAYMSVTAGGNNAPAVFNPKIMTGFGFNIGPVVLDIPFTFYPIDQGYNVGLTLGVAF